MWQQLLWHPQCYPWVSIEASAGCWRQTGWRWRRCRKERGHCWVSVNISQSSIGSWSWWLTSRYNGDVRRTVRTTFNILWPCTQSIHWKDEAEEEEDEDEDDEKEEDLAASEMKVDKARKWLFDEVNQTRSEWDVKWVKCKDEKKLMAEASSRLEKVLKSDNTCSILRCVPDNIYTFFPPGFSDFFFFKSTGPKSEYKRNWRNSDKLPSKAGETAAFETSRSDAPDPKENAGSLSRWLAPRRRLKSAACLFFVSSLFCSSYLHISTIKKNELHGFSASFFSQYPCLYRHVCTGDALHSTTCDLVDRCWPHFLLFSLAHPNQNDQPMSNL